MFLFSVGILCEEVLIEKEPTSDICFDDGIESLFPLFPCHGAPEYLDESIPFAAQEEIQTEVENEYFWSEDVKLLKLENYEPSEEDIYTGTDNENISFESQPMEQEDPETFVEHEIVDEKELGPVKALKDEDHIKPKQKAYSKEKYRKMLMFETEWERTQRLAKRREYNNKYLKQKREERLTDRRRRDAWRGTEERHMKMLKDNERRRRCRQRETLEQRERRLNYMREYKRRKALKRTENSSESAEKVDNLDEKPCVPSNHLTSLQKDGSLIERSHLRKTVDNLGRSAVEIAMERGLPRLEVRLERIDVKKVIEEIRTRSYPPVAADYNCFSP